MGLLLVLMIPTMTAFGAESYRRWLDDGKTFTCTDMGGGIIQVGLSNQNVEFSNLPADAQFTINYIQDGVIDTDGPFTVEQTSGTRNYAAFQIAFSAYPLTFEFRLDTIIDGTLVYQSSLIINCAADASGPVTPINTLVTEVAYRRWLDDGKTFTCTDTGTQIEVFLNNQNVEFFNLPVDAQFTINYIRNGVITTDGPYTVEQTSGTRNYGAFMDIFPSYPLTFEFRLDTIINGIIVYQSSLIVTCAGDLTGTLTPVNVIPGADPGVPGGPGTAAGAPACLVTLPSTAVQGRMLETTTALFEPDAGATTSTILPVGTSWWVIGAESGFYRLWIACQANAVWVPASAVGPNFDLGGAALPDAG